MHAATRLYYCGHAGNGLERHASLDAGRIRERENRRLPRLRLKIMVSQPFSSRRRSLTVASLRDGYGFAFDFANPSGVKLLRPLLFSRIAEQGLEPICADSPEIRAALSKLFQQTEPVSPLRLTVWYHITNQCNFRCHYCYIPNLNQAVSKEEIEKAPQDNTNAVAVGQNLIRYCLEKNIAKLKIVFAGGEPTFKLSLIRQFCAELSKNNHGIKVLFVIISNGSFESKELLPLLREYRMKISLSVDGFEDGHDRTRFQIKQGVKVGNWKKLSENVEELCQHGVLPYFLYTVTAQNYDQIAKFAAYAQNKRLGFRLSLVRAPIKPTETVTNAVADELCSLYRKWGDDLDPRLPLFRYAAFAEWNLYVKKHLPCTSCRNYFAVDSQGGVATCQMRMNRTYGNAVSESFSNIVARLQSTPENRFLSHPHERRGVCTSCEFFHVCASGCPQHNLQTSGSMDTPSPWCQVYGRLLPEYVRAVASQLLRASLNVSQNRCGSF